MKPASEKNAPSFWRMMIFMLLAAGLALIAWLLFNPNRTRALGATELPVAVHSGMVANYSADLRAYIVPAVRMDLVEQALADSAAKDQQVSEVLQNLGTPVPTVTPYVIISTATPANIEVESPNATAAATATSPVKPTEITRTNTPLSSTLIALPSRTPNTNKPTETRVIPTNTAPAPTATIKNPTATQNIPTATQKLPTATQNIPTATQKVSTATPNVINPTATSRWSGIITQIATYLPTLNPQWTPRWTPRWQSTNTPVPPNPTAAPTQPPAPTTAPTAAPPPEPTVEQPQPTNEPPPSGNEPLQENMPTRSSFLFPTIDAPNLNATLPVVVTGTRTPQHPFWRNLQSFWQRVFSWFNLK